MSLVHFHDSGPLPTLVVLPLCGPTSPSSSSHRGRISTSEYFALYSSRAKVDLYLGVGVSRTTPVPGTPFRGGRTFFPTTLGPSTYRLVSRVVFNLHQKSNIYADKEAHGPTTPFSSNGYRCTPISPESTPRVFPRTPLSRSNGSRGVDTFWTSPQ